MPYRRTARKTAYRKRPAKSGYVRKVARVEARKAIAKTVETKMYDSNYTAQAVDYTNGFVSSLTASTGGNSIIRGTAEDNYIGDSIRPVGFSMRMQFTRSDSTQLFRVVILQNKAGGIPLTTTLFQSVSNVTAPLSHFDKDYVHTYNVLLDRLISMDQIRDTTLVRTFKVSQKRLRSLWFNDGVGNIQKGGIYVLVISDSAVATHPTIDYRCRLYYKDA